MNIPKSIVSKKDVVCLNSFQVTFECSWADFKINSTSKKTKNPQDIMVVFLSCLNGPISFFHNLQIRGENIDQKNHHLINTEYELSIKTKDSKKKTLNRKHKNAPVYTKLSSNLPVEHT